MDESLEPTEVFPRGIATGPAFCDRRAERSELAARCLEGRHTWLAGPRRHGKTSLLHQTLIDLARRRRAPRVRGVVADLLPAYDRTSVQASVLDAVGRVVAAILPSHRRVLEAAGRFFSSLRPRVSVSPLGVRLELQGEDNGSRTLVDTLTGLDQVAAREEVRAVLVLDEFQQIGHLADAGPAEAAIRHAAERAESTTYVFSGSHRHLLAQLFLDPDRPLYQLCEPMELGRIDADHYLAYLREQARARWPDGVADETLQAVLERTERHPHYLNLLCSWLWRADQAPGAGEVDATWQALVDGLHGWLAVTLEGLSKQQLAVLSALAAGPTDTPTGRVFLNRSRVPKSSVAQALEALLERGHVRRDDAGRYRVQDPALGRYLRAERSAVPRK